MAWLGVAGSTSTGRRRCIFLRRTYHGVRCILMSPEDWKRFRNSGNHLPCWEGGNTCKLKARILSRRYVHHP